MSGRGWLRSGLFSAPLLLLVGLQLNGNPKESVPRIVFTQMPIVEPSPSPDGPFQFRSIPPDGSRIVLLQPGNADPRVLTDSFAAAADPCLSFDGQKLLFAAKKKPGDRWDVWEMDIRGGDARRLTADMGDCREPIYMARGSITPPDFSNKVRWIVYTSTAPGYYDECGAGPAPTMYTQNIEPIEGRGVVPWRINFNLSHVFSPSATSYGRVLFSSWRGNGRVSHDGGRVSLMASNWAGTGLNPLYGSYEGARVKAMPQEFPDRTVLFIESDGDSPDGGGRLAMVDLKRPLHTHRVLSADNGRYLTPYPYPDGQIAVAHASKDSHDYGLFLFDRKKKKPGKRLYDSSRWAEIDPIPLVSSPEPMGRIPIVGDTVSYGDLQCLDVYDSDWPEAANIKHGDIKWVRLVEGIPDNNQTLEAHHPDKLNLTPFSQARILGETEVQPDGSFYVRVPADTPFLIQALDENRVSQISMSSWMWVRRGSRRGCIGCHENKEMAPRNRLTDALRKLERADFNQPPRSRRTVDFRRDVVPILQSGCINCHNGEDRAGGLVFSRIGPLLRFVDPGIAYRNLMIRTGSGDPDRGKYVVPGEARNSLLFRLLAGGHLGNVQYGELDRHKMPLEGDLNQAELRTIIEWIDLGAQWDNLPGPDDYSGIGATHGE
ncbi:hypothetical protein ACFLT7_01235 [candidate division KSB1 bacterium]